MWLLIDAPQHLGPTERKGILKIGHHILSISRGATIQRTQSAIQRSLERLASGSRVSRPSDDIVGFAQSTYLDQQSRGLRQLTQNLNLAQSELEQSSIALSSQLDLIADIRVIALEASSTTISGSTRQELTQKLQTLLSEFSRIQTSAPSGSLDLLLGPQSRMTFELPNLSAADTFRETVGTGTFASSKCFATGDREFFETADLNGDGNQDIVTADTTTGVVTVQLGTGEGNFSGAIDFGSTVMAGIGVVDVTGDGILDIAINDGNPSYYRGLGDGTFEDLELMSDVSVSSYRGVFADFTNDGVADFVFTDTAEVYLAENDGTGTLLAPTPFGTGMHSDFNFEVADVNNDGWNDVAIVSGFTHSFSPFVYTNNKDGTFTESWTEVAGSSVKGFAFGHFNNDEYIDFVYGHSTTDVYIGDGTGAFTLKGSLTATGTLPIVAGDLNNDGLDDLITGNRNIFLSQGDGTFRLNASTPIARLGDVNFGANFGLADFNNDGILDLATGEAGVAVALGKTTTVTAVSKLTDVSSAQSAQDLLEILDQATESIRSKQSEVMALHSRLDYTKANHLLTADVLDESRSRLLEPDYALEVAELTRLQILQQAQTAVAAQSNLQLSIVLKLLSA